MFKMTETTEEGQTRNERLGGMLTLADPMEFQERMHASCSEWGGTVTGITFGVTGIWLGVTGMRLGPPPFAYGTGVAAATLGDSTDI